MSGLACCWPPSADGGGGGSLEVGLTPVVGGLAGEFLKVGPGGLLDQSGLPPAPVAIGAAVTGGDPDSALFIDSAGKLAQDPGYFDYDKADHKLTRAQLGTFFELTVPPGVLAVPLPTFALTMARFTLGVFPDTHEDPVVNLGFNIGAVSDPDYGAVFFSFEGKGGSGAPGENVPELHLAFSSRDRTKVVRGLSFSANVGAAVNQCDVGLETRLIAFTVAAQDGTPWGYLDRTALTWLGGFACNYNAPALAARNFGDTAFNQLISYRQGVFGFENTMRIADDVPATGMVEILRPTLIYSRSPTDDTAPLTLISSSKRTDFFLRGGDPNGALSASPGALCVSPGGAATKMYLNREAADPGTVWDVFLTMPVAGPLDLSAIGAGPILKLPKTAIVPLGALVRFKVLDETGAVFYLTGQAA
jgi:hypothetical protein